jgi:hypothetical protein
MADILNSLENTWQTNDLIEAQSGAVSLHRAAESIIQQILLSGCISNAASVTVILKTERFSLSAEYRLNIMHTSNNHKVFYHGL